MTLVARRGSTDTVDIYPPRQWLYQPSAADARAGTPSVAMPAEGSETALTPDSVSTTVSAASRGDDTLTVASGSGITAGVRYLLEAPRARQVVRVSTVSGTTVYLSEPLLADIPATTAFKGLRSPLQLTTDQTATAGEGLVVARLTLNGIVRVVHERLRIEEQIFPLTLTTDRVLSRREIAKLRSAVDLSLDEVITAGWEDVLRVKLRARRLVEHRIKNPAEIEPAHLEAVLLLLLRASSASMEVIADQERRLERTIDEIVSSPDFTYSPDGTLSATVNAIDESEHGWVRLTR